MLRSISASRLQNKTHSGLPVSYRLKLFIFASGALGLLFVFNVGSEALKTLSQLDVIEAERDTWQRPGDVIDALALKQGDTVVDLGCGSGYFTLKLSPVVGRNGRVVAEDIRRESLAFLRARSLLRHEWNVSIDHGTFDDPQLPAQVDAVLLSNTFHELQDPQLILKDIRQALVPSGRVVILDRSPGAAAPEPGEHAISADVVEGQLRRAGFKVVSRQDRFIGSDPAQESWWLIAARG
jgi:ubiquinone/menaquinone biosynthesis C-methylase UbiE